MSWTCSPASAIALRLASAARVRVVTPDLRENAVHPIPTIAVLSLIACSGMFNLCFLLFALSFKRSYRRLAFVSMSQLAKISFNQLRVFVEVFRPSGIDRHNLRAPDFHVFILWQVGSRDQSSGALIQLLPFFREQEVDKQPGRAGVRCLSRKPDSDHQAR